MWVQEHKGAGSRRRRTLTDAQMPPDCFLATEQQQHATTLDMLLSLPIASLPMAAISHFELVWISSICW